MVIRAPHLDPEYIQATSGGTLLIAISELLPASPSSPSQNTKTPKPKQCTMATIRNRNADDQREDRPLSPRHHDEHTTTKVPFTIRAYFPALLLFMSELFELLLVVPKIRLLEAKICRNYYDSNDPSVYNPDGSIPELMCKIPEIQARLAHIKGWQVFWEGLPGMARRVDPS